MNHLVSTRDYKTLVALGARLSDLLSGTEYERAVNVDGITSRALTKNESEDVPMIPRSIAGGTMLEMEHQRPSLIQNFEDLKLQEDRPKSIANKQIEVKLLDQQPNLEEEEEVEEP